ncbi:oligosaccharide flippase family protein [Bifidobacterium simiiventris]|uniref:oligosaccharide flippase family protein n=1 Tax=Bifidobacterium simiiventris TaxID=2834434 RepID=UPI001C56248A|nr:oligosaccharide flippase family protein [Bifidobacterium simiiventris]MBW3079553.1 oligosaccharide flippase family protein [Bifidobacterium simiiventris]
MVSQRKAGAALGYVNVVAKNLVNLLYVPLLLHFLGQGDYGVFQMTNSVVFALTLLSAGFYGSYVRFYMRERAHGSEQGVRQLNGMFLLVYIVVACLCIIGGLLLIVNVHSLFSGGLTAREVELARQLLMIMSVNIAVQLMSTPFDSYIVAHERFTFQQTRQLFTTCAMPLLAVALLYAGFGAVGVACAQLSISSILLLLNIRYAVRTLGMRFTFTGLQWSLFKAIAIFSFWIFLNQIFDLVNNNVPNFLLGAMASSSAVATFAIAVQIRNIFFSMSTTMSNVFVPQINKIVAEHDDNDRLTKLMTRVGRYQMILFWFIYGGFVVVGQAFVRIWAGHANTDAYWLSLIMTLPVMIPLTQNTGIEIQRAKNRHKVRSIIYIFTSLIDIVISVLCIPAFGYWATAWGYVASILLGTGLFMNWYYHYRIGLDMAYFWKNMMPTIITSIAVTVLCWIAAHMVSLPDLASLLLFGVLYCIVYVTAAWLFIANGHERGIIQNKLHRSLRK